MHQTSALRTDQSLAIWQTVRDEATVAARREPILQSFLQTAVLDRSGVVDAMAYLLGQKLGGRDVSAQALHEVCASAFAAEPQMVTHFLRDLQACHDRDPACRTWLQPLLYYKGVAALQTYRVMHWLWGQGRETLAYHLQSQSSQIFQVDIHPAAKLGGGLFMDHATGIVVGETTVVGEDVTIMQSVTLGGNGKERGDRHPKVGNGVLISVGAKVLGNIRIGDEARIAASSVVLHDVPPRTTVAGVPAKPVRSSAPAHPAADLDHVFSE